MPDTSADQAATPVILTDIIDDLARAAASIQSARETLDQMPTIRVLPASPPFHASLRERLNDAISVLQVAISMAAGFPIVMADSDE